MKIKKYLDQSPLFAINLAYENIVTSVNKNLKSQDINLLQGLVLTALLFEDRGDLTPSQLAATFQTSRGNMSHIISHLEYKGWVKRSLNPADARQFRIELKAEGKKKALTLIKFYDKIQNEFEDSLGQSTCLKSIETLNRLVSVYKESQS